MLKRVRVIMQSERFGVAARLFEDMIDGVSEADEYVAAMFSPVPDEQGNVEEPEHMEMFCDGRLRLTDDTFSLSYEESELTGFADTRTTVKVSPSSVTVTRAGKYPSMMTFEKGQRHMSLYETDYGPLTICIATKNIDWSLDEKGGSINVSYDIEVQHAHMSTNSLCIEVKTVN